MNKKNTTSLRRIAAAARRPSPRQLLVFGVLAAGLSTGAPTRAAGGHHAVDDAALLEPGQCQLETWWDRESGGARTLLHAGPACRVGPVEVGLNFDRVRLGGAGTTSTAGAQVKWARSVRDGWSAGVVFGIGAQDRSPGYLGSTLLVPVTWQTTETLLTHLNVGRDFRNGHPGSNRAGLALEWSPLTAWSFVAERFRESGTNFWRAGARWSFHPSMSLDFSRARGLGGSAPAWWTLGLTWVFDR
jgi:hypothetical protein